MKLPNLNFDRYSFRLENQDNDIYIFDIVRKKFILLQPEEWVRQHVIQFLLNHIKVPLSLINVEKQFKIGNLNKRYDVVVYSPSGEVMLTVECKSPKINISQESFNQIALYNLRLDAVYMMLTNGLNHYYFHSYMPNNKYIFLERLPLYKNWSKKTQISK